MCGDSLVGSAICSVPVALPLFSWTAGHVLICAGDDRTCAQLKEYVTVGAETFLTRLYKKTVGKDKDLGDACPKNRRAAKSRGHSAREPRAKKARKDSAKPSRDKPGLTLTQMLAKEEPDVVEGKEDGEELSSCPESDGEDKPDDLQLNLSSDAYYGVFKEPLTVLHPLNGCSDPYALTRVLHEVEPRYVVLYDAELTFVRQLEVYKASRPGKPLRYINFFFGGGCRGRVQNGCSDGGGQIYCSGMQTFFLPGSIFLEWHF